jgi:hypothetical protein
MILWTMMSKQWFLAGWTGHAMILSHEMSAYVAQWQLGMDEDEMRR